MLEAGNLENMIVMDFWCNHDGGGGEQVECSPRWIFNKKRKWKDGYAIHVTCQFMIVIIVVISFFTGLALFSVNFF
jgi:hypothetical protein